jgi:lipid II:glycine glycyltransferase (peptidoglycan interpeptide bridge formation enzyme)
MVEIVIASEKNSSEWDRVVDSSANATLFHRWEWLKTVEKYTRTTLYPIIGIEDGTPIGIFPLFLQKMTVIKLLFSPPPATTIPYLGPVMIQKEGSRNYDNESSFMDFCSKVFEFSSSKIKPNYARIALPPGVYDSRPFIWSGYEVEPYYCYYMDLTKTDSDGILRNLKKRLRNGIYRATRFGVIIREGGEDELEVLYGLMQRRYKEQDKLVTVSKLYLNEIYNKFKKNIKVWVADYKGEIITGTIDLCYKNKVSSWIGNPKPEIGSVNANDLLNWTAIKWACDSGLSGYLQMGTAGVPRLYSFYSKFNFELLLSLTAKKYSSPLSKIMENAYTHVIKPTKAKFNR